METPSQSDPEKRGVLTKIVERMSRPVSAAAIDLFRISAGGLVIAYIVRLFIEYSDYTSESGLLDHELHREIFWFTKLSLIYPGSSDLYKLSLLTLAFIGGLGLLLGVRPKVGAALAWIVVVSVQRWNFAVINVDDSSITLLLWWMMFLPIGHTLTLNTLLGRSDRRREFALRINGFFVRAFFVNLFIYYLTAGLTKFGSELWREGLALFVVLNLPLARTQGFWQPEHLGWLWFGNHYTLIIEPLLPFIVLLRKGHPLKYLGAVCWVALHVVIPVTIGVPYANFTLVAALILVFHEELGEWLKRRWGTSGPGEQSLWQPARGSRRLIACYLLVLALAMQKNVPILEKAWEPAMGVLYLGGVAQEYHLFDWIDRFNWTIDHTLVVTPEGKEPFTLSGDHLFPSSVRGFIVQSYLLSMRWMRVPRPLTGEMRNSVIVRSAERLVVNHHDLLGERGQVTVESRIGRLDRTDLTGENLWPVTLMRFDYEGTVVTFDEPQIPEGVGL